MDKTSTNTSENIKNVIQIFKRQKHQDRYAQFSGGRSIPEHDMQSGTVLFGWKIHSGIQYVSRTSNDRQSLKV